MEWVHQDLEGGELRDASKNCLGLFAFIAQAFPTSSDGHPQGVHCGAAENYAANPRENFAQKDVALFILTNLTVKEEHKGEGVLEINNAINVSEFFTSQVLPKLEADAKQANPLIQADCLGSFWHSSEPIRDSFEPKLLVSLALKHLANKLSSFTRMPRMLWRRSSVFARAWSISLRPT